jgi:NAD-dependent deacetylase
MRDVTAFARDQIGRAERIVVLTGAGVSAESGVPTFRGTDGLWRDYRPEDLATPAAFARDPRLVWEWYDWRRRRVSECRPNAAHLALAKLAIARGSVHVRIVTQNVDGLHAVAAREAAALLALARHADTALPLELHGSLFRVRCPACDLRYEHADGIDASSVESLPRCTRCHSVVRPDVVWFGEPLDDVVLNEAVVRARRADVCLVVGTSAVVQPAASLAMVTKRASGQLIEVNPDTTPLTPFADVSIRGMAGDVIPRLVE